MQAATYLFRRLNLANREKKAPLHFSNRTLESVRHIELSTVAVHAIPDPSSRDTMMQQAAFLRRLPDVRSIDIIVNIHAPFPITQTGAYAKQDETLWRAENRPFWDLLDAISQLPHKLVVSVNIELWCPPGEFHVSPLLPLRILEHLVRASLAIPSLEIKPSSSQSGYETGFEHGAPLNRPGTDLTRRLVERVSMTLTRLVLEDGYLFSSADSPQQDWQVLEAPHLKEITLRRSASRAIGHLHAVSLRSITIGGRALDSPVPLSALRRVTAANRFPKLEAITYHLLALKAPHTMPIFDAEWASLKTICSLRDVQLSLAVEVQGSLLEVIEQTRALHGLSLEAKTWIFDIGPTTSAIRASLLHLCLPAAVELSVTMGRVVEWLAQPDYLRITTKYAVLFLRSIRAPNASSLHLVIWAVTPALLRALQDWSMQRQAAPCLTSLSVKAKRLAGWVSREDALSSIDRMETVLDKAGVRLHINHGSCSFSLETVLELD